MKEDCLVGANNMNKKEQEQEQTHDYYFGNEEEADEEALSLCDLPLSGDHEEQDASTKPDHNHNHNRRHDCDGEDLFEFSSNTDHNSDSMSSAEDIFFCGKLLPYKTLHTSMQQHNSQNNNLETSQGVGLDDNRRLHHLRSESIGDLRRSQLSAKDRLVRSSYSLDYRKLHGGSNTKMSSPVRQTDRSFSTGRCFGTYEFPARRVSPARPRRWHLFTFGLMRTPVPEMELRDIRNRLTRRAPASLFPALDGGETVSVKRDEGKSSWRLLRAFGCKRQANVAVTASLGCIPHV